MKRICLITVFSLFFTSFIPLYAQWARTYGGTANDYGYAIQQTSDGGYIVAGNTKSFGAGMYDIWVLKISSSGIIDWQNTYGDSDLDEALSIEQTSDGGYIVAGNTKSFGAGMYDIWVLKFSSTGTIDWQNTYGGSDLDYDPYIRQTNDGGYIVVGSTYSFSAGGNDIWVLKLFSDGTINWQHTYGGSGDEYGPSIQQTSDGGYIVAGNTYSFGAGGNDIWALKLSSTGIIDWQRTYGGTGSDAALSIEQTIDGGYIIAGSSKSFAAGVSDIWILKLSSTGTIDWQNTYGGSNTDDGALSIQQTSDGGYIVVDYTYTFGAGDNDIWVLKLSSTGTIEWQRTYGGSGWDSPSFIQQTSDGGFIVVGHTKSFGAGEFDFLVLKLDSNGDIDPSCELIGTSSASVVTTNISPEDTYITPGDTYVTPLTTNVSPQDTNATVILLCEASQDNGDGSDGSVGDEDDKGGGCFIATAAYGSPLHPHVEVLRDFRDKYLMPNTLGHKFVYIYYRYSPFLANIVARHKALKIAVQIHLIPVVVFSYSMVHFGPIITEAILLLIIGLPVFFAYFSKKMNQMEA